MATSHLVFILFLCTFGPWATTLASPADIITSNVFSQIFPNANSFYTYNDFISAAGAYPNFGSTGDSTSQKQELAAFLANVQQETGSLQFVEEIDKSGNYCDTSNGVACPAGADQYYGRGPLQLTWNYNYNAAGQALGLPLLDQPGLLASDGTDSWKSALWFWNGNTPSCHDAITGGQGFGSTIRIINGGIECGKGTETQQASNRIMFYQNICSTLGVDPGSNLGCA